MGQRVKMKKDRSGVKGYAIKTSYTKNAANKRKKASEKPKSSRKKKKRK